MKNLKKDIRKSLIEIKTKKENRLIESKIVQSRLLAILESNPDFKNFKKLSFERQWEIGVPFLQEVAYLKDLGMEDNLITEQGLLDILGKIFGTGVSAGSETIFEAMLSSMLRKLGLTGFLADTITFFFVRNPGKIMESFRDCRALSKNLGQAVLEAYINKLTKEYNMGGLGSDFIRNALLETLENSDFGGKVAQQFSEFVCGFFDNVKQKGSTVMGAINQPKPATT